jgi:hypothetical protein
MNRKKQKPAAPRRIVDADASSRPKIEEVNDHAYDLYIEHQKQAWADCQSGSDEFDKSILTFSSLGLSLSLAFIKDIVPLASAVGLVLLYTSWVAFGVAILITIFSFQLGVMAQEKHLDHLRRYYLDRQRQYLNAPNKAASWVGRFKWVSGGSFVFAIAGTIVFSVWNVTEARHMSENKSGSTPITLQEGRRPMSMTPLWKGRKPMSMTPLPSGALPSNAPPQPASSNTSAPPPPSATPKQDK